MLMLPQIPGYDLLHPLSEGGRNVVFRARELQSGVDVAIKLPGQQHMLGRMLLEREAQAGLQVRHPHLVSIRSAHLAEAPYFLVMDLLPGISLRSILQDQFALDVGTALRVARQVAEALAALHRVGFIHGDVKPENVQWVDAENVVLIDLAFARRSALQQREDHALLGTPNYLAPECCSPHGQPTDRSDIFSLGVMLFEILTGELPYPEGTVDDVLELHRQQIPADLRDFPGNWPWPLVRLLHRMLAFRPCDRPAAPTLAPELIRLEVSTEMYP
jgi:serine/threonine protein kinase